MAVMEWEERLNDAEVEVLLKGFFKFHDVCGEVLTEVMRAFREYRDAERNGS